MRGVAVVLVALGVADLVWINVALGPRVLEAEAVVAVRSTAGAGEAADMPEAGRKLKEAKKPVLELKPEREEAREPEGAREPEPERAPESEPTGEPERKSPTELPPVSFRTSRASLDATSAAALAPVVKVLEADPRLGVTLTGHADVRGGESINYRIGIRRARAVRRFLVRKGISADRITVASEGEAKPRARGDGADAHRTNRRVEITLLPNEALR